MEQHHASGDKNAQAGYHGPERLPRRGADHEEAPTCQVDSIVCCVYDGGADLHYHGTDEEWQFTGIPTRYARYVFDFFIESFTDSD